MDHYLQHMDKIYAEVVSSLKRLHEDSKIDNNFTIYRNIIPVIDGVFFRSKLQLRKRNRTSVILVNDFNNRKTKQYFSEYNIIKTLIFLYDYFPSEGDSIFNGLYKLINDEGHNVIFEIDSLQFSFAGIGYLDNDNSFNTFADYLISINDFICLLNLVIEKDRYSAESNNGKGTILKYILFLLLCSKRTTAYKQKMINILKEYDIYKDNSLHSYKSIINKTGESKLYFAVEHFNNII